MELTPITLRQAQAFVNEYHRHNIAPRGHKFSIGLEKDGILIGVCVVGRPIARYSDDGKTAEGKTSKRPKGWDTPSRRRETLEKYPEGQKIRWSHN